MENKKCFKCGMVKQLSDFYDHPMMGDGHLNKCKECTKKDAAERRSNKLEECREYDRKRGSLPHRVEARKQYVESLKNDDPERYKNMRYSYTKKYREKNKQKYKAHRLLDYHISNGDIKREPCFICGSMLSEGHHPDYDFPLSVIWLCDKHHKEEHRRINEIERRKEIF
jgi:hypothetical protein